MVDRSAQRVNSARQKCLLVAPYWRLQRHLGSVRTERFVRWLSGSDVDVTVVCCGQADGLEQREWGTEIAIRDPLHFYKLGESDKPQTAQLRRDNPLRRIIAYLLLVPDPLVLWARRAAGHHLVAEHAAKADWILASSPPESVHVAAEKIARKSGAELIVDLRDGWLDEPFIPMVRANPIQLWRHGRLERRIVSRAAHIFVTNELWMDLLTERLPEAAAKTSVLTNAYPTLDDALPKTRKKTGQSDALTLLYAGRIRSRTTQRESDLLEPLLASLASADVHGRIVFLGAFSEPEMRAFNEWQPRFASIGWDFDIRPPVPREEAMAQMRQADGLLMLSTFKAPVPAKFFEYVAAQRPILAAIPGSGMVSRYAEEIRQMFVLDLESSASNNSTVEGFLSCCRECREFDRPEEFSEKELNKRFLQALGLHLGENVEK